MTIERVDYSKEDIRVIANARRFGFKSTALMNKYIAELSNLSNCCQAQVFVSGSTTKHYTCSDCKEPCDLEGNPIEDEEKEEDAFMNSGGADRW